jgi:hypothetical protein
MVFKSLDCWNYEGLGKDIIFCSYNFHNEHIHKFIAKELSLEKLMDHKITFKNYLIRDFNKMINLYRKSFFS